mmetsp:Transcript_77236/g.128042  ORF Transcript_77236/g.128042 Transcript_77236/m.128042 type:complete len:271 (-) Transcript_77236:166-978(-)
MGKPEAYVSEFVGTFFLVLTVGFNVLQNTALAPVSIGSMLMVMIFATGKVSGGHYNPAVTVGVWLRGNQIDSQTALSYVLVQVLGGLFAGLTYTSILSASFTIGPGTGHGMTAALVVEILFTAALVFVVLNVATTMEDQGNWYFGLAIGFTVMAAAFAIGPVSGAVLNPAVAFGVMVSGYFHAGLGLFKHFAVYAMAQLAGACLATGLFYVVREAELNVAEKEEVIPFYTTPQVITSPSLPGAHEKLPQIPEMPASRSWGAPFSRGATTR